MNFDVNLVYNEHFFKRIRINHVSIMKKRQIIKIFNDFDKTGLRQLPRSGLAPQSNWRERWVASLAPAT